MTISSTQIDLTWVDNSNNEEGFKIEYGENGSFTGAITVVAGADTGSKWITGLASGKTYHFRIQATNSDGDSGYDSGSSDVTSSTPAAGNTITVPGYTRANIITAINNSSNGDTIFFPAGTYNIPTRISSSDLAPGKTLGGGRIYLGETVLSTNTNGTTTVTDGTYLHCTATNTASSDRVFFNLTQNDSGLGYNIKFSNLTFQGSGIFSDTVTTTGVVVTDCHFDITNNPGTGGSMGIEWSIGWSNSSIINNVFTSSASQGIYGYNWDNLTVANNEFSGDSGLHLDGQQSSEPSLLVEQNYFNAIHHLAVEIQGNGQQTVVQDNYYENHGEYPDDTSTFGFSVVDVTAVNPITRRNYAFALPSNPVPDSPNGVRVMYELGGQRRPNHPEDPGLQAYDNYSNGGYYVIAVNGASAVGTVHDNRILNFVYNPFNNPFDGANAQFANNGPGEVLSNSPYVYDELGPNVSLT